jgi:DMSO/TMAO reductase YedYZ molybdopterin-dependent catalytic subunit
MSFFMDRTQDQPERAATPFGVPADVTIRRNTGRHDCVPPGQSRTKKRPVLDAGGKPRFDLAHWRLRLSGLLKRAVEFTWQKFLHLAFLATKPHEDAPQPRRVTASALSRMGVPPTSSHE